MLQSSWCRRTRAASCTDAPVSAGIANTSLGTKPQSSGMDTAQPQPSPVPHVPTTSWSSFPNAAALSPTGAKTVAPRARSSPPRAARSREVPGRAGASTKRWPLSREEEGSWHKSLLLCQGSCSPAGTGLLSSRGNPAAVRGAGDGAGAGALALSCWGPGWGCWEALSRVQHRPLGPQTHRIIKAANYQSPEPCLPPFPGLFCSCLCPAQPAW